MSNVMQETTSKTQVLLLMGALVLVALALNARAVTAEEAPAPNFTWEGERLLSTTSSSGAFRPSLRAAGNGDLIIAYNHNINSSTRNPYYRLSTDGGESWSAPAPIYNSSSNLRQVTVDFDNNNVAHAAWYSSSGLFHAAQNQWPSNSNSVHATTADILDPMMAISSDNVLHLVWAQGDVGSPHNIYHAYSQNGGTTWSSPVALATNADHSSYPNLDTDSSGNVYVVWEERVLDPELGAFRYELQYKRGSKVGSAYAWDASPSIVSGNALKARRPAVAVKGNTIHFSYAIQESNDEQYPYYRRYSPGSGWSVPRDVSNNTPVSVNTNSPFFLLSSIQVCGNNVYIYYHGSAERNANEQIWGASSTNNWTMVDEVTGSDTRNIRPALVCLGGNLHLGIERVEQATVNHQIYYNVSNNVNELFLPLLSRG
ncbi:MAG TPA: sialidase family protein [Candidatus Sulfomarinibacteraceae bacterium]|nr:sialidase family protein [Candidatus Sulfomarinibacteraceae bacterium]